MKKIFLPLFVILSITNTNAQTHEIDSLKQLLATTNEDTTKVLALAGLSFRTEIVDSSLRWDYQGLALARKIKFTRGEAVCLNQLGNDFWNSSNYPKALDYYLQSLKINEKIGNLDGAAANYGNMANILAAQADYAAALTCLYKAVALHKQTGSPKIRNTYSNLGRVYEKMNQLDSARFYYQKSSDVYNSISDKYQLYRVLYGLGNVNAKLGNAELAFAYYRMGITASTPFKGSIGFTENYYGLAKLFQQTRQIDSSFYYAKKALVTANRSEMVVQAAMLLSELYERQDDKQSFYYYKIATKTKDSILTADKQLQLKNMTYNEQERQNEIASAELKTKEERKHNLQYAAIAVALITFLILFFTLSRSIIVKTKFIEFFGVLGLLAVFEFTNLFIHPYLSHATNDSPVLMLLILIGIGALLVPLHHRLEKWITKIMVEKNKKIRLAAAKKTIATLEPAVAEALADKGEQTN